MHLTQVLEIDVVHRPFEVRARAGVAAGYAADHLRRSPVQSVPREPHDRLTDTRDGHEAIGHLSHAVLRPAQSERIDEHQLAHQTGLSKRMSDSSHILEHRTVK